MPVKDVVTDGFSTSAIAPRLSRTASLEKDQLETLIARVVLKDEIGKRYCCFEAGLGKLDTAQLYRVSMSSREENSLFKFVW